jgi:hypothetical protein
METKKIRVELDEVKVVNIMIDLGDDIENYMSKFLALKNHERETKEILEVRNFYGSNHVSVTLLIDEESDQAEEVERCKDFVGQFGKWVGEPEVDTAYILDKDYNGINSQLDWKELYIYD